MYLGYLVIGVVFAVLGEGLFLLAKWSEHAGELLNLLVLLPAYTLFLFSFTCFFGVSEMLLVWAIGYVRVLVIPDEGLWLSNGTRLLGQSSIQILFTEIVSVITKRTVRGVELIQIVHGHDLKTEIIDMIRPADFDSLLALLEGLCPKAFVAKPTVAYDSSKR
jgi:hypothetical protein